MAFHFSLLQCFLPKKEKREGWSRIKDIPTSTLSSSSITLYPLLFFFLKLEKLIQLSIFNIFNTQSFSHWKKKTRAFLLIRRNGYPLNPYEWEFQNLSPICMKRPSTKITHVGWLSYVGLLQFLRFLTSKRRTESLWGRWGLGLHSLALIFPIFPHKWNVV